MKKSTLEEPKAGSATVVGWETGRSGPDRWGTWASDYSKANRDCCGDGPTTAGKQWAGGKGDAPTLLPLLLHLPTKMILPDGWLSKMVARGRGGRISLGQQRRG